MDLRIALTSGGIGMDTLTLKGLSRGSNAIAHLSEQDKDLVMQAKDERFPKTVAKPQNAEPSATADGNA